MNPTLDIPFDETDGSEFAYDFGPGAHHATVTDGHFIPGKFGNCLYFAGEGNAEIIPQIFDFTQDFSFMLWIKAEAPSTNCFVALKFVGVNNFRAINLYNSCTYWTHFCITQRGNLITIYVNGEVKGTVTRSLVMTGFALLSDHPHNGGGFCSLDGGQSFPTAVPPSGIQDIINHNLKPVEAYINNVNFKSLGVAIEKIEGVLDMPDRKDPLKVDWDDYHGEVVDLIKPVFGPRDFELQCWFKAANEEDLVEKWLQIRPLFESPGLKSIRLDAGSKPLLFMAYHPSKLKLENKWRKGTALFGRFTLRLKEPMPVKRVLKVTGSSCSITLTSQKMLSIFWGDSSATHNLYGTSKTTTHSYASSGEYYVVIAGNIEEITDFSTDAAIVWSRI